MPPTIAPIAWFTIHSYPAHRALDPSGLPRHFKDWLRRAEKLEKSVAAQGLRVVRVELDPEELAAWCRERGAAVDSSARRLFVAEVYSRQGGGEPGTRH